jgi:hypothetical protein
MWKVLFSANDIPSSRHTSVRWIVLACKRNRTVAEWIARSARIDHPNSIVKLVRQ